MSYSQKWWVIVALLFAFALTVSVLTAQTEEPSAVNAPSSAEVQADSAGSQASSDEPEQKQPTLEPNRDTTSADVENERRFNELRRELLDDRAKMIDDRAKTLDWWLAATAIFLTLLGVGAAILGYFGFKRLDRIESEARENVEASEKHAQEAQRYEEEAQRYVEDIKTIRDKAEIDRAFSEAILLQQQNRIEESLEKWRSIANVVEGTDREREAQAWFSIAYLLHSKDEPDFDGAINAYDVVLRLNPNDVVAYNNRGVSKDKIGRPSDAIADYDMALSLNPNYAEAYNNRGISKDKIGRPGDAIADYDAALSLNPDYPDAYYNRGLADIQLNLIDEARQDFEKALNLAQATGNTNLAAKAAQDLSNLDRGDAP